ncbi:NAD(P)/FAD-dependent oxidoreductase [Marinoscillum sp. MHG1-6]|uniref:phytoene desaturase family protein n=1 Tax=Marinoscillum sp. MHG1-6 TaxID=2959627 RepID=UPI002157391A|nr:phytoene desaturase family protein [Marinoscillum sp. MHG1-6]
MKAVVIGSGFAGMSSAALIAKDGHEVTLLEKNAETGGRARVLREQGFSFDMGPSWYWMPDVFDRFFSYFGKSASDYYDLVRLEPNFKIFFENEVVTIPDNREALHDLFERLEPGSSKRLEAFMEDGAFKYEVGVNDIIYRQPNGIWPFIDWKIMKSAAGLHLLKPISKHIRQYFKHPYLIQLLEFPVLFLGADPKHTPALYSMMDYAGLYLGTWYPMGGFGRIADAFKQVAEEQGVRFIAGEEVKNFDISNQQITQASTSSKGYKADTFVISGDYHHFDTEVLPEAYRQYSSTYWDSRVMAPSAFLYYIGFKGKLPQLEHHNMFFDTDFGDHSKAIYETVSFPERPQFYVSCSSKTDPSVAPEGHENLVILIPVAAGLENTELMKEHYFNLVCDRMKEKIGVDIRPNVVYRKDYAVEDFKKDYHAFRGNAYGLANTLKQTAFLKPNMRHKKLKNTFFTGQLSVPGPGVPPSIVSGELAANYVNEYLKSL